MKSPSTPADDPSPTAPATQPDAEPAFATPVPALTTSNDAPAAPLPPNCDATPKAAIPIALYALPGVCEAIDRAAGAPDDLAVQEAIMRRVYPHVLRAAMSPPEWCSDPNYEPEDVANSVMEDLLSGNAPVYDRTRWTMTSHYFRKLVRTELDRRRNCETTRPVVRTVDPSNPDGPPVVDRPRRPRYQHLPSWGVTGAAPAEGNDTREEFRAAVEQLRLNQTERAIIEGHYFGNLPLNEVASHLDVAPGAVYKAHERLLEKLRLLLARFADET